MSLLPDKLPGSDVETKALIVVSLFAGFAALARGLYGKDDMSWRYSIGSILVAMSASMAVYASIAQLTPLTGYAAVAIGTGTGLFTDETMRRLHAWWSGKPLRTTFGAEVERRTNVQNRKGEGEQHD